MNDSRKFWRPLSPFKAARLLIWCAVLSLAVNALFAIWASLFAGGERHFEHTPVIEQSGLWPPVGDIVRPPWWHFDQSNPQWWWVESTPDHYFSFMRFATAIPSSGFGEYDFPEPTEERVWPDDYIMPPPGAVDRPFPAWIPIWDTPEGFWRRYPGYDGAHRFVSIGWPRPAFVVRLTPTHDSFDDDSFGAYEFFDRLTFYANVPRRLPRHVHWPGLAINTFVWMPLGFLLYLSCVGGRRGVSTVLRRVRIQHGLCPSCRYPLTNAGRCPECGSATPIQASDERTDC